ncbi:MAG TPA: restriction endonuclease [Ruminococcaceae bacterium]|jgi:site-specific DNA-methyltransferase (adenine-specific)|nr:restriction endonuclease [Oscillospiraceae bacterium]
MATYKPDVLSCLANLSNDEVFTPPKVAKAMLDMLPQELFENPGTTFLDPVCKTGVFLREIAKRLMKGLATSIPDEQARRDHIFHRQIFGIAITELTSLMARRSLYCSKYPNGYYSVTKFDNPEGNIRYKNMRHRWKNGHCVFCGASEEKFGDVKRKGLESYAYEFIHTTRPEDIFKMKFDVIIGNPPYQLDTGGSGRQAKPIYQLFIEQAKKLNPRYLSMIIPSRWFAGGMGLDEFRQKMLKDKHIQYLVDYSNAKDCFPQNSISGGVCYFLRSSSYEGPCVFTNIKDGKKDTIQRKLNEYPVLIRYNTAVTIVRKVVSKKEMCLSSIISSLTPFGLPTNYRGKKNKCDPSDITLYSSAGKSYISINNITKGKQYVNKYKVMISKTSAEHAGEPGKDGKYHVIASSMRVLYPQEVCTHSYFVVGEYDDIAMARNLLIYLQSKFSRFLILQSMSSINLSKAVFQFVPIQDFSKPWTDKELYAKYGLTETEINFIESMIKPMKTAEGETNGQK